MKTILYFSPTGNARFLAVNLAASIGADRTELLALEFTEPEDLAKQEALIILYSVHAFNPPRTVRRFVKNIPAGLYEHVSIIGVGCIENWLNQAASTGLRKVLEKKGYAILLDEIIAMPLTFIMAFPDEAIQKTISAAGKRIEQLAIASNGQRAPGEKVLIRSKLAHFLGKAESPVARLFGLELHANKQCTSCGICVNNCPEKNIRFNAKDEPRFALKCLVCMRCIYNCPEQAIAPRFSKFMPIKDGYDLASHLDQS
jgi:ferredoxin